MRYASLSASLLASLSAVYKTSAPATSHSSDTKNNHSKIQLDERYAPGAVPGSPAHITHIQVALGDYQYIEAEERQEMPNKTQTQNKYLKNYK